MNKYMLNKRKFILPVLWCGSFGLSGLKDFAFAAYYTYNYNERVETPTAPNSNSSSAEAIFDQKIPLHSFQTKQNVRGRFEESSRIVRSKIHPNGPELTFEQKQVTKILSRPNT